MVPRLPTVTFANKKNKSKVGNSTSLRLKSLPLTHEEDQLALEQRLYEESLKVLDEGQVLTGTIVQKDKDELLVDVGGKSEGVLPFREYRSPSNPNSSRSATRWK